MKKYLLYVISAILVLLIVLALPGKDSFILDADEIVEIIGENEYIISMQQLELLQDKGELKLIDLSSNEEFLNSAIPGAINLPLEELDIPSINEFLSKQEMAVLYARETSTASTAWILLTQMGYENLLILDRN